MLNPTTKQATSIKLATTAGHFGRDLDFETFLWLDQLVFCSAGSEFCSKQSCLAEARCTHSATPVSRNDLCLMFCLFALFAGLLCTTPASRLL